MKLSIPSTLLLLSALLAPMSASAMPTYTAQGVVWEDSNCDGIRQDAEPTFAGSSLRVYLFAAGADNQVHTTDDQLIEQSDIGQDGTYLFSLGTTGVDYRVTILAQDQPADLVPAPYRQGTDRSRDNDLTRPLTAYPHYWSTNAFRMNATDTITGVDLGLCRVPTTPVYLPLLGK